MRTSPAKQHCRRLAPGSPPYPCCEHHGETSPGHDVVPQEPATDCTDNRTVRPIPMSAAIGSGNDSVAATLNVAGAPGAGLLFTAV